MSAVAGSGASKTGTRKSFGPESFEPESVQPSEARSSDARASEARASEARAKSWRQRSPWAAIVSAVASLALLTTPAYAADPDLHYPTYSAVVETSGEYATTATFPGTNPSADVTSNRPLNTASTATLGADTRFGAVFGSSAGKAYLRVDVKATAPTVTTITFATELQADQLGMALGDIDAESVVVTMVDDSGTDLSASQMGSQDPFNYAGDPDLPTITEGTNEVTVADSRCVDAGQQCDTNGATAWFQPETKVKTITLTGTKISGLPEYQLWLAIEDYQRVTWNPTATLDLQNDLPATFTAATTSGDGALSYQVTDAGSTGCTVDSATRELSATSAGTCLVTARAATTDDYLAGATTVAFIIDSKDPQVVTWDPTTTITLSTTPRSVFPDDLPNSTGNGTKSYAVTDAGTAQCTVDPSTGEITAQSLGTCDITVTAAATSSYDAGSTTVTFTFVAPPAPSSGSEDDDDKEPVITAVVAQDPELAATGPTDPAGLWLSAVAVLVGAGLLIASRSRLIRRLSVQHSGDHRASK